MKRTPATIYRYRTFSESTISALCSDRLYFSRPEAFNDPLDCKPNILCDSDLQSLRHLLKELVYKRVSKQISTSLRAAKLAGTKAETHSHRHATLAAEKALTDVSYFATDPDFGDTPEENEKWLITQEINREIDQHYDRGVCCFSATDLHPLLWSHYGDSHRGLCIGYTLNRKPRPDLRKAIYGGPRSVKTSTLVDAFLHQDQKAIDRLDRDVLLRKADCWNYEDEWRLVGTPGIQDSTLKLHSITFGLRCSREVMHTVVKALERRDRKIKFFEIQTVYDRFRLQKACLDLDELGSNMPHTAQSPFELFGDD